MNELITSYGLSERKGEPVVSSRKVADIFGKRHDNVMRDIETIKKDALKIEETGYADILFIESTYKDSQNRKQPEFLMNRDAFSILAMGFTGKKALQWKIKYISAFNEMENFIKSLNAAKLEHPAFTQAIMDAHAEPKHYHFSNEADMINRIVLGVPAKKFRELNGIEKGKSIRPYLSAEQIKAIEYLQRVDIGFVLAIPDYEARKEAIGKLFEKKFLPLPKAS